MGELRYIFFLRSFPFVYLTKIGQVWDEFPFHARSGNRRYPFVFNSFCHDFVSIVFFQRIFHSLKCSYSLSFFGLYWFGLAFLVVLNCFFQFKPGKIPFLCLHQHGWVLFLFIFHFIFFSNFVIFCDLVYRLLLERMGRPLEWDAKYKVFWLVPIPQIDEEGREKGVNDHACILAKAAMSSVSVIFRMQNLTDAVLYSLYPDNSGVAQKLKFKLKFIPCSHELSLRFDCSGVLICLGIPALLDRQVPALV